MQEAIIVYSNYKSNEVYRLCNITVMNVACMIIQSLIGSYITMKCKESK